MSRVEQRLSALERAVATLAGQRAGGETRSPSYLTITPGGLVGADFTGLINALGLVIPAGVMSMSNAANRVVWDRVSDGTLLGSLTTWEGPGGSGTESVTTIIAGGVSTAAGGGADSLAELALYAVPNALSSNTWLDLVNDGTATGSVIEAEINTAAGTVNPIIARGDGVSDFAQLQTTSKVFIDNNNGSFYTLNFSVPANSSQTLGFTTGRPSWTTPLALGSMTAMSGTAQWSWQWGFTAPNTIDVAMFNSSGAAGTVTWSGMVVGA